MEQDVGGSDGVGRPTALSLSIGGYPGPFYSVTLDANSLLYDADGEGQSRTERIAPTEKEWTIFRRKLDAIGVWDWRPDYPDPGTCDGTQWSVEIKWGGRSLRSTGSNCSPGPGGEFSDGEEVDGKNDSGFWAFTAAVQDLLSGLPFD